MTLLTPTPVSTQFFAVQTMPRIFYVNWFRKDDDGRFLWPGFGDNSRVLDWIARRCAGEVEAVETPIGYIPRIEDLDTNGLEITNADLHRLLDVDMRQVAEELPQVRAHLDRFSPLPDVVREHLERLADRAAE